MKNIKEYLAHKSFKYLKKIFLKLQPHFKKDTYILFDNLYEKNAESIDTWCIFQYMQSKGIKSYYVLWKENSLYKQLKEKKNLKNVIVIKRSIQDNTQNNFEFFNAVYLKLFKTKAVLTSFGSLNTKITELLYTNKEISYIHTGHGTVFLKNFILTTGYFSPLKYNKFIVSSDVESQIFQQYGWDDKNLLKLGLPRWDNLKRFPHQQKTIFVMFTWRNSFGKWNKEFKTSIDKSKYYQGIMTLLHSNRLKELLTKYNVKLCYTLHHAMLDLCKNSEGAYIPNITYVPSQDISKYIGLTDLFITDYSSLAFDFAFLNIPIIFYRPDFDDKSLNEIDRQDMAHAQSKDKELFNICYDDENAINNIEKYIKNDFLLELDNREKLKKFFTVKENITQQLINYLEQH